MGTRSLTVFKEDDGTELAVMYGQWDGGPDCHGKKLIAFLKDFTISNGISDYKARKVANGMGCLALQVMAHFKRATKDYGSVGRYYLYPVGTRDVGEEYIYTVYNDNGKPKIVIDEHT